MKTLSVQHLTLYKKTGAAKQACRQTLHNTPKPVENHELFDHLFIKNEPRRRENIVTRYLFSYSTVFVRRQVTNYKK